MRMHSCKQTCILSDAYQPRKCLYGRAEGGRQKAIAQVKDFTEQRSRLTGPKLSDFETKWHTGKRKC